MIRSFVTEREVRQNYRLHKHLRLKRNAEETEKKHSDIKKPDSLPKKDSMIPPERWKNSMS